jgi:hypothetical protein
LVRCTKYIALLLLLTTPLFSQNSVLSSGQWYRVGVDKNGVYRLTMDHLKKMGFNTGSIDPRKIKIFGQRGGMLPQSNSESRPEGLVELAIFVNGEEDGKLGSGDFILFYAEGPERSEFIAGKKIFRHQHNLYSDKNYYFITVGDSNGKRIAALDAGSGGTVVTTYDDYIHHEVDEYNMLESGREWYGENFNLNTDQSFSYEISGLANGPLKFVSEVMAKSLSPSSFKIYLNEQLIGEQVVDKVVNSTYATKGKTKTDTIVFTPATNASTHVIRYTFQRVSATESMGYLNFFSIHFTRNLALYADQVSFRSGLNVSGSCLFNISSMTNGAEVWNVSDPYEPKKQSYLLQSATASFTSPVSPAPAEYIAFNQKFPAPELSGPVDNQDLRGAGTVDFVVVTHPDFTSEAQRLATHRAETNNWTTLVVTPQEIFNEFSSGRQDVTAIRDFIKHLHDKNPGKLKALLLFGKSSYDYKDRVDKNTNFVPTYESRNSLSPLETYSSDDYYTFLEIAEGEWPESIYAPDYTLDIGVGRLPVKTVAEAAAVVDKLIDYDKNLNRVGRWRKDIIFVADDGSNSDNWSSLHQGQANSLAEGIEYEQKRLNTRKIFLGTYTKDIYAYGERMPQVNREIRDEFNKALIINYTGHGAEEIWADEYILNEEDIESLKNETLPFLVTATCEFGRHDNPVPSSAELALLKPHAGCAGLVTTARPVNSFPNFALNNAFYDALFSSEEPLSMGEVFRLTKNNSTSGVSNRNFSLLGDPGMKLALPRLKVEVTEIKTSNEDETLKALSTVIVKGKIVDSHGATVDFNGTVNAGMFDKQTEFATIGRNSPPYTFREWYNPVFRGNAPVKEGLFEFQFIMPRNIAYETGSGKLSLYAWTADKTLDAAGGTTDFNIGGSEENVASDITPPEMQVYMGDSTFRDGGRVSPNTTLVVKLFDDSGINISNYGIGNTAVAILDHDSESFIINEYYEAESGDFRRGWIYFPVENLTPGKHTLTVKVWDVHNNAAEKVVSFVVTDTDLLQIEDFGNYPNPFPGTTTLFFTHNRPGDDLDLTFQLLNAAGQQLKVWQILLPSSSYREELRFDDIEEFGQKLPPGLYFGRVVVRSLSDGGESSAVTKLIVSN